VDCCHTGSVIDTGEVVQATPAGERRQKRWIALGVIVVVAIGVVTTTLAVSWHYLHAPVLVTDGGGWLPPDNQHSRFVSAGPYTALVTAPRPGHAQTFAVEVYNPSSVTQTVLGLADDTSQTLEPERLTVSTTSTAVGDAMLARYTSRPVAIPPQGVRTVRLINSTAGGWKCRTESWTELRLRVRVGAFTRTETVAFGSLMLELRGSATSC
jgi:hypothetical protein